MHKLLESILTNNHLKTMRLRRGTLHLNSKSMTMDGSPRNVINEAMARHF